jgi:hypothetical protein
LKEPNKRKGMSNAGAASNFYTRTTWISCEVQQSLAGEPLVKGALPAIELVNDFQLYALTERVLYSTKIHKSNVINSDTIV